MTKTIRIYLLALVLLFIGAVIIEFSKPRPINWSKTYNETHRIPYGTYIFYNELGNLFPDSEIINIDNTPYEFLRAAYNWDSLDYDISGTYMYIDEYMNVDAVSAEELLDYASHGNTVFIASSYLPEVISDSLHLGTEFEYDFRGGAKMSFANPRFKTDSISIDKGLNNIYFSELDSLITTVLGYQNFGFEERINFVKVNYGSGQFILHLQPVVFTNYNLLKDDNKRYTGSVLSYIEDQSLIYDKRNKTRYDLSNSRLRFILSQPALKWAWLVGLVSILLFLVFNAKRKQRVIPLIKPLENTTVAFTKTIGNLYYETKDHQNIIEKKITYFLEHLRRVYYLDTQIMDEKFIKTLSQKSGKSLDESQSLIKLIKRLNMQTSFVESDLIALNKAIESFFRT